MTYDRRTDDRDDTRVVERDTYVERDRVDDRGYVPPAARPAGSQVNVNAGETYAEPAPGPLYYARRVVSLLFAILAVLIGIRIVFLLLVANENDGLVNFIYTVTEPFVAPFRGIFQFDQVNVGEATLDIAAVVALIGWLLIYVLILAILNIGDRRRT